jgi:hypothetical protein
MEGDVDAEAFSNELAALKRGGCTVLVTSDAPGRSAACERLLGAPELDRSHVFLAASSSVSAVRNRHQPRRTDADSFAVVDATPATRSAAAASASTSPTNGPAAPTNDDWLVDVDDPTDFHALYEATRDALVRVADGADAPGETRLCVDGLDPLLETVAAGDATEEELFRLLHMLTGAVRDVNGMGHVHVSEAVDESVLGTFEPLFDATVEIETTATGGTRQRWTLHESGRETDWFRL